jgi:hypothetical protein
LKQVGNKVDVLPNIPLALNSAHAAPLKIFYGTHHLYEDEYHNGWRFSNSKSY